MHSHEKNPSRLWSSECVCMVCVRALYPLGPVATLRFCHLRPRCVSKQRRTTNVIISDRVWWIWCDAGLATVATRPQRSPHSVALNSRPDYFAATRSRSLFLSINECCVSAAAAAIWEIQWRRSTPQLAPVDTGGQESLVTSPLRCSWMWHQVMYLPLSPSVLHGRITIFFYHPKKTILKSPFPVLINFVWGTLHLRLSQRCVVRLDVYRNTTSYDIWSTDFQVIR